MFSFKFTAFFFFSGWVKKVLVSFLPDVWNIVDVFFSKFMGCLCRGLGSKRSFLLVCMQVFYVLHCIQFLLRFLRPPPHVGSSKRI